MAIIETTLGSFGLMDRLYKNSLRGYIHFFLSGCKPYVRIDYIALLEFLLGSELFTGVAKITKGERT